VALLAAEIAAAFVVTPILLRGLGAANYGAWEILIGLLGYFGFLDLGISAAILRFVAHEQGGAKHGESRAHFVTGFWMLTVVGLLGLCLFLIASQYAPFLLGESDRALLDFASLVSIGGAMLALSLPLNALSAYLLGLQKFVALNGFRIGLVFLRAMTTVLVMKAEFQNPLQALAFSYLTILTCEFALLLIWVFSIEGKQGFRWQKIQMAAGRQLLSYGANSTLLMLGTGSLRRVVAIVIAKVLGLPAVAQYAVANRLVEYAQSFVIAVGYPLTAHFSVTAGAGNLAALREDYLQLTKLIQYFSFGVPIGIMWLGEPFLHRWLGSEVTAHAQGLLVIFGLSLLAAGLASNAVRVLFALAKHRQAALFSAISSPLLLVVCVIATYEYGILGAAASVALHSILNALVELSQAGRALQVSIAELLTKTAVPYLVPAALMCLLLLVLRAFRYPTSYFDILAYSALATALYSVAVARFVFNVGPLVFASMLLNRGRNRASPVK